MGGPTGSVDGCMQLYSKERSKSNVLEGHCSSFATVKPDGAANPVTVVAFAQKTAAGQSQVQVVEVGGGNAPTFPRVAGAIRWEDPNDFPTSIAVSEKHTCIYMLSKMGYVFIYDLLTATPIFQSRISESALFVTSNHEASGGVIGVNRNGQVLQIAIDGAHIVNHICNTLNNVELAVKFAARNNLPGAEGLFARQFDALFSQQRFKEAAQCAAESPMGVLRTADTIRKFQQLPAQGGASPILQYFQTLLEHGKLNALETVELARPAVQQGKLDMLRKWWDADKLEASQELGDLIWPVDKEWGMSIFVKSGAHSRVVQALREEGQYDSVPVYAENTSYVVDYISMLALMIRDALTREAVDFSIRLMQYESGPQLDVTQVMELFMSHNLV